eukprot:5302407-Pleurochrysis_carterae.AAC.2
MASVSTVVGITTTTAIIIRIDMNKGFYGWAKAWAGACVRICSARGGRRRDLSYGAATCARARAPLSQTSPPPDQYFAHCACFRARIFRSLPHTHARTVLERLPLLHARAELQPLHLAAVSLEGEGELVRVRLGERPDHHAVGAAAVPRPRKDALAA